MAAFPDPDFNPRELPGMPELLELRLRARGNREALSIIDRCIVLACRAAAGSEKGEEISAETEAIAMELALRYGAPRGAVLQ